MKKTWWLGVLAGVWAGLAWAQAAPQALGPLYAEATGSATAPSRLVVFRPQTAGRAETVAVEVQGRLLTTLVGGSYQDRCFAPGEWSLSAWPVRAMAPRVQWRAPLAAGQTRYVRVGLVDGVVVLTEVPQAQAHKELKGVRRQSHTLARVGQACALAPSAPAVPTVATEVVALWRMPMTARAMWSRPDRVRLNLEGRRSLQVMVARVQRQFARVDSVRVLGHVDAAAGPQGPAQTQAAWQRVRQVQQVLQGTGARNWRIEPQVLALQGSPWSDCRQPGAGRCSLAQNLVLLEVQGVRR